MVRLIIAEDVMAVQIEAITNEYTSSIPIKEQKEILHEEKDIAKVAIKADTIFPTPQTKNNRAPKLVPYFSNPAMAPSSSFADSGLLPPGHIVHGKLGLEP